MHVYADTHTCSDYEKSEFPLRMREWLYFVMEDLASRDTLVDSKTKRMAQRAEEVYTSERDDVSETQRWVIPVMWKFCDLDATHDE